MLQQFKDILQVITFFAVIYGAFSQNNWVLYLGVLFLFAFLLDLVIPKVWSFYKARKKKAEDNEIWSRAQTELQKDLKKASELMEHYKRFVADQSWAYSMSQALRSNGNNGNPLLNRLGSSLCGEYIAGVLHLAEKCPEAQFGLVELSQCFQRVNGLVSGIWREATPETKNSETSKEFVQRYNRTGADLEELFQSLHQKEYRLSTDVISARFAIHAFFTYL